MRIRIAEMAFDCKGWRSMKKVSEALSVDHQTVLYWNQGRAFPRLPMLVRLRALFGCSLEDLLEE